MRPDLKSTEQEGRQQVVVLCLKVVGPGSGSQTQAEPNAIVLRGEKKSSFLENLVFLSSLQLIEELRSFY